LAGPFNFASASATVRALVGLAVDGTGAPLLGTAQELVVGFALAAALGILAGLLVGSFRVASGTIGVLLNLLFVTTIEALLPLILLLTGVGFAFRVTIVVLFALPWVALNTAAGVRSVDATLIEVARAYGSGTLRIVRSVVLPSTVPFVLSGLRLGLGAAVGGAIVSELWVISNTGQLLYDLGEGRRLPEYFAVVILIAAAAIGLTSAIELIRRRVIPWSVSDERHDG
ncbi:MAG TPA: ABC transporter permease subunit, partial [Candidatus Limnocylindrales bacterium]|nr:ABC transporter permease subunit [Candidatus Limnocylindrales bacterium]